MATFSVNDQVRRVVGTGDGSNDAFDFSFQVNATTDVKVYVDGTLKTASSHYNVVNSSNAAGLNTDGTGRIKFTGGNIPANAAVVTILSDVPAARTSVYTAGGTITAASLEQDFDTQTMLIGDREERDSRALLAPVNDPTNIDMTLPAKSTRAGKVLGFDTDGDPEATQQVTGASVSVSGLSAGASPTASVSVSGGTAAFALGIPAGATGATGAQGAAGSNGSDGAAATIAVGSVTTGSAGSSATVVNAGSSSAATFNFSIPQGATGAQGATGPQGPQGPAGSGSGDMLASNNLSDVANAGTARTNLGVGPAAGSSNIVTTGALNSGSITSGFGSIDNGSSAVTTTGVITGGTLEATADTSAGDNAAIGFTAAEGLILTGQGSTNDVTIKNDADADVLEIPTGTTNVTVVGNIIAGGTVAGAHALSHRNVLYNGSMAVSQRGTSSTGQGASDLFLVDRFHLNTNGNSAGRFTVSQASDGPSGIPNSLKLACTTADTSIAASERLFIEQRLEGQDCQRFAKGTSDAQPITVSFYVKGNAAATYVVGIFDSDNNRQIGAQFSVTTSWSRVSVTFPADTGGSALDDDNAESLSLRFYLHAGSTYTGGTLQTTWDTAVNNEQVGSGTTSIFDSTSRTFFLTGVQMELGEQATPFEHEDAGTTLRKCQRFYYLTVSTSSNNFLGYAMAANTTNMYLPITFPTTMRSNPTSIDVTAGSSGNIGYWLGGAVTAFTSVSIAESGTGMTTLNCAVGSGLTAEKMYGVLPNGNGSIGFNSEL